MILLCSGVLLAGSTFQAWAASYQVTATVPAPTLHTPAIFLASLNQQHFSTALLTVGGSCPPQSYVKVYRSSSFSGVAQCTAAQTFQMQIDLDIGANQLQARVFNATDVEGPPSSPVTVYYDPTILPPAPTPSATPTNISIAKVETGQYWQGTMPVSSVNPTISGVAPPFSVVTVTFHSAVETCVTTADWAGNWRCTLDSALPVGIHHVDVVATASNGLKWTLPTFEIAVSASLASLLHHQTRPSLLIGSEYRYQTYQVNQPTSFHISASAGTGPYVVTVDWGDGIHSQQTEPNAAFTVTHAYQQPNTYIVMVKITDSVGTVATLQLSAIVKANVVPVALASTNPTSTGSLFGWMKHWMWVVWPLYIIVSLMALSYWIGEQEAYRQAMSRRRVPRRAGYKK